MNAYAQIAALEGAQRQYDNACPAESEAWIDTNAGEEWLRSCHFNLTHFMDVKIGSMTVIKHGDFVRKFSERRVEEDGEDDQFALDVALIKGERCTKYDSLRDKVIHEMCLPLAQVAEMADRDLKAWLES